MNQHLGYMPDDPTSDRSAVRGTSLVSGYVRKVSQDGSNLFNAKGVGDSQILATKEGSLVNTQWSFTTSGILSQSGTSTRSEEHTSELQSHVNLVCRLLLEKKNKKQTHACHINSDCYRGP